MTRCRWMIGRRVTRLGVRIMRLGLAIQHGRDEPEDNDRDGMVAT